MAEREGCNIGYEVNYSYHKKEDGKYNTEETKTLMKKVGDPFEDVPLEKLAAAILMQMARRDIMVVDVKITELKKQEISFKETPDGVVIKNRKFTMENIAGALEHKEANTKQEQFSDIGTEIPRTSQQIRPQVPITSPNGRAPKRIEIFDPQPDMVRAGLVKGKFTPGKRYPIFEEKRDERESNAGRPLPILCLTVDDMGRQVFLPDVVFRPPQQSLIGGNFDANSQSGLSGDGLAWDGVQQQSGIQDIRGRR
jgi:hypothetical protein